MKAIGGGVDDNIGEGAVTAAARDEPDIPIGVGDRGDAVRGVQAALRLLEAPVPDDERAAGTFGTGTLDALRGWQTSVHLEASGVLDDRTRDRLRVAIAEGRRRSLFGRVTTSGVRPLGGSVVRAFDQNLDGPRTLGEAVTDDDGRFQIDYTIEQLGRADKVAADLLVRVFASESAAEALTEKPVLFHAEAVQLVHLVVPDGTAEMSAGDSEPERLLRRVLPILAGKALEELRADVDVAFVAESTGMPESQLRALAASAALAAEARTLTNGVDDAAEAITVPLLYGWVLDHPAGGLDDLLAGTPEAVALRLRSAALDGGVPLTGLSADEDGLVHALTELKAHHTLRPAGQGRSTSVGDVLHSIPAARRLDKARELTVANFLAEGTAPDDALAERLGRAGFTERQVRDVQVAFRLSELADGDPALVGVLQSEIPADHDGTLVHLAGLSRSRWLELVASAVAPDAGPDTELDATLLGLPAVAARLADTVEQLHPSAALKAHLDAGLFLFPGVRFPSERVAGFLGENPSFDIERTDVEPFLGERGIDASKSGPVCSQCNGSCG